MTDTSISEGAARTNGRLLFLTTICVGSFLLFLVQPMVARMALPRLGGAPSVWNSAMLVYQALLLAGYGYAHWLSRMAPRQQAFIHLGLFALAALMLPIGLSGAVPPSDGSPYFWVPWLLLSSIGPLFLVVSTQAPLMQRWYGLSGGGDPYPLYAASNLGSFAGLVSYPLIVEPLLAVTVQSAVWTAGYILLAILVALCAWRLPREDANVAVPTASTPPPELKTVLRWVLLAAIPSGLMLSTTLHLTTDIVAMPLIWVLPLGLYLLSFSVAFVENRSLPNLVTRISPFFLLFAGCATFIDSTSYPYSVAVVVLLSLFMIATALHAYMFEERPGVEHLTRFYLAMSAGGVLGGLFCALLAPLIFDWTYEHPILLVAAALAISHKPFFRFTERWWRNRGRRHRLAASFFAFALAASLAANGAFFDVTQNFKTIAGVGLALFGVLCFGNRLLFALSLMLTMLTMNGWDTLTRSLQEGQMTRSYFGVYSLRKAGDGATSLVHGTTLHGLQLRGEGREMMPTTYYAPKSGVGLAMAAAPALYGPTARISVVGLGAGTLSCYTRPGQQWKFYEIDPVIEKIARDPKSFSFLSRCNPDVPVVIGDARLKIASGPANQSDILVIDAFSSDAVPMHLLTAEAFDAYRRNIGAGGLLMVHISNRYFDFKPVIAAVARNGWTAALRSYDAGKEDKKLHYSSSIWVALAPDPKTIRKLVDDTGADNWVGLPRDEGFRAWTDSYGSILPLLFLPK